MAGKLACLVQAEVQIAKYNMKINLHSILSLSDSTLNKLVDLRKRSQPDFTAPDLINFSNFRSLSECFDVFKLAHDLVDCAEAVQLAVENVIREFSEENCVYLELRSTPRATSKMTKEEYLNTVINTMMWVTHRQFVIEEAIITFHTFPSITHKLLSVKASQHDC